MVVLVLVPDTLDEKKEVARLATLIKKGILVKRKEKKKSKWKFFDIWKSDPELDQLRSKIVNPAKAPKEKPPHHSESYRPPPEYVFSEEQNKAFEGRVRNKDFNPYFTNNPKVFAPKIFPSVRKIPAYQNYVSERFSRCLDLYLVPRKKSMRVISKADDYLPELPKPKDLRPFPTMQELIFKGHRSIIRTISIHPQGKYLASGSDDRTVKSKLHILIKIFIS